MQAIKRLAANLLQTNDWPEQFQTLQPDLEAAEDTRATSPPPLDAHRGPRDPEAGDCMAPFLGRMSIARQTSSNGAAAPDGELLPYAGRRRRSSYMADGGLSPAQSLHTAVPVWASAEMTQGFSKYLTSEQQQLAGRTISPRQSHPLPNKVAEKAESAANSVEGGMYPAQALSVPLEWGGSSNSVESNAGSSGGAAPARTTSDRQPVVITLAPVSPAPPFQNPTQQPYTDDDMSFLSAPPMQLQHAQQQVNPPPTGLPDGGHPAGPSPAPYRHRPFGPKYPPVAFPTLEVTTTTHTAHVPHPHPQPGTLAPRAKQGLLQGLFGLGRRNPVIAQDLPLVIVTDQHPQQQQQQQQPTPVGLPPRHRQSGAGAGKALPGPTPTGAPPVAAAGFWGGPLANSELHLAGTAQSFTAMARPRFTSGGGAAGCPLMIPARIEYSELYLICEIGEGGFGKVYRGLWRGSVVAVKEATLDKSSQGGTREFEREVATMSGIPTHQNVLKLLAACSQPPKLALVTEYCARGSLYGLLHSPNSAPMSWRQLLHVCEGIARGMQHLHYSKVLHRDLKSANILLDDMGQVKICDFGLSKVSSGGQAYTGGLGTHQWMAPEVLNCQVYSNKADVFSFAIVAWECLTRKLPYEGMQAIPAAMSVVNQGLRPIVPPSTPADFTLLIQSCWAAIPDQRPSFQTIAISIKQMLNSWGDILLRQTVPGWLKDQQPIAVPAVAQAAMAAAVPAREATPPQPTLFSGGQQPAKCSNGGSTAANNKDGRPTGCGLSPAAAARPAAGVARPAAQPAESDSKPIAAPPQGGHNAVRSPGLPITLAPAQTRSAEPPPTPSAGAAWTTPALQAGCAAPMAQPAQSPPVKGTVHPVSPRPPMATGVAIATLAYEFPSPLGPMATKAYTDRGPGIWGTSTALLMNDMTRGEEGNLPADMLDACSAGTAMEGLARPGAVCVGEPASAPANYRGSSWKR